MTQHVQDRYFAGFGIASVVLMLAGVIIGSADHNRTLTITSSSAQVARAIASPAGSGTWVGAYVELLSFGFFLAFAVWACAKLGGGLLGQVARACATSYATLSIASLGLLDAIAYRSGKGMSVELGRHARHRQRSALRRHLVPGGVSSADRRRPRVVVRSSRAGRSAIGVAAIQLVTTAVSVDNFGQMSFTLWLVWIVAASIGLARGEQRPSLHTSSRRVRSSRTGDEPRTSPRLVLAGTMHGCPLALISTRSSSPSCRKRSPVASTRLGDRLAVAAPSHVPDLLGRSAAASWSPNRHARSTRAQAGSSARSAPLEPGRGLEKLLLHSTTSLSSSSEPIYAAVGALTLAT